MLPGPSAKFLQDGHLLLRDGPVRAGADVQQQVPAHGQAVHEGLQDHLRGLEVEVRVLEAPGVVDGVTQLPVAVLRADGRDPLLRGAIVAVALDAGVHDDILVVGGEKVDDFGRMPGLGALLPVAVEPEQIRLVCLGELGKLRLVEIHEALPADGIVRDGVAGLVLGEVGVVRMRPVQQGIVEPHFQSPLARFLDKRRQDVAAGRCLLRDAEIGGPGVPKGDAVVVFGRDNRVFRTALPDEVRPIGRVVLRGCEPVLLGHVLLVGKVFVVKGPAFGHAVHGIDSPMDEDAQLGAVGARRGRTAATSAIQRRVSLFIRTKIAFSKDFDHLCTL